MPAPAPLPAAADAFSAKWQPLSLAEAAALVADGYDLRGAATVLNSERDETFLFTGEDGRRFILKVANPVERGDLLDFQQGAMLHLERAAPDLPVPRVVRTRSGEPGFIMHQPGVGERRVRLLSFLDGMLLPKTVPSAAQHAAVGDMAGRLARGLARYRPAVVPEQSLLWDIAQFMNLERLRDSVAAERRPLVSAVFAAYAETVLPQRESLPRQVIHNDFNPYNILVDPQDHARITGIIDFGDMVEAPRVNDIAVALAYHLAGDDPAGALGAILRGYSAHVQLDARECAVLPVLIMARVATTILVTEWRAASMPENSAYILRNHPSAMRGLGFLQATDPAALRAIIAAATQAS
jgi:Ser/Thr protein kinase RdoA (MazF antagonist)